MTHPDFSDRQQDRYSDIPTNPNAFVAWAAERPREEGKFELSRGVVQHSTINVTRAHSRVCTNLVLAFSAHLDRNRFDIAAADFAVKTKQGIRGPDVLISVASADLEALSTNEPLIIAEVLSPSSIGRDFTEKLAEYTAIESLGAYLICSQDEPRLWCWQRGEGRLWPPLPHEIVGRQNSFAIAALDIELAMAAIFRGIPDMPTLG